MIERLRQVRRLTGTGVYLKAHLNTKNADTARQARTRQRHDKTQQPLTRTRNWKVMIRLSGSPETLKAVMVREIKD